MAGKDKQKSTEVDVSAVQEMINRLPPEVSLEGLQHLLRTSITAISLAIGNKYGLAGTMRHTGGGPYYIKCKEDPVLALAEYALSLEFPEKKKRE